MQPRFRKQGAELSPSVLAVLPTRQPCMWLQMRTEKQESQVLAKCPATNHCLIVAVKLQGMFEINIPGMSPLPLACQEYIVS